MGTKQVDSKAILLLMLCCALALLALPSDARAKFLPEKYMRTRPRGRVACYPSSTIGTRFPDPAKLGPHRYRVGLGEKNGIVYTCRGGHIDIVHIRKVVDWNAFWSLNIRRHMMQDQTKFRLKMREPSRYHVTITYPEDWKDLSGQEKKRVATELAIQIGQYLTYTAVSWHEMITWFGFKSTGFYPEYPSAFTWEDNYSNLVGVYVAGDALRDPDHEYTEAVTIALDNLFTHLGAQPKSVAHRAGETVRGMWFKGEFMFMEMLKRHFDIGLGDGEISPWLVDSLPECAGAQPLIYTTPTLDALTQRGFTVKMEIEPREWERAKVYKIIYPDSKRGKRRVIPEIHFAPIMAYIENEAKQRYGPDVGTYESLLAPAQQARSLEPQSAGADGSSESSGVQADVTAGGYPQTTRATPPR